MRIFFFFKNSLGMPILDMVKLVFLFLIQKVKLVIFCLSLNSPHISIFFCSYILPLFVSNCCVCIKQICYLFFIFKIQCNFNFCFINIFFSYLLHI